jgi:hypothetical protein
MPARIVLEFEKFSLTDILATEMLAQIWYDSERTSLASY